MVFDVAVSLRDCWVATACVLAFASSVSTAVAEEAFQKHCARCHPRAVSVARSVSGQTDRERKETLDRFLASHHAEDPKLRAAIVDYLVGLSAQ
jgi:hypothetical protein